MNFLEVKNLSKSYRRDAGFKVKALDGVSFEVKRGEFFVILGPSGCGKSTLLNLIAGFEKPDSGEIFINGKRVSSPSYVVPPAGRDIAMVFQTYALYPHMTVYENIEFPLKMKGTGKEDRKRKIEEISDLLGISHLLGSKPAQLSGGERQRVALARALVRNPAILLMDEPLSNLDAQLRNRMRTEIKRIHSETGTTTLYVTHDQTEALTLADRMMIMKEGRIVQIGKPHEIYEYPANEFVASFLGNPPMNIIECEVIKEGGKSYILMGDERVEISREVKGKVRVGIRPSDIEVYKRGKYRVTLLEYLGDDMLLHIKLNNFQIVARISSNKDIREGDCVGIKIKRFHIFK